MTGLGSSRLFRLEIGVGGIGVPKASDFGFAARKKHLQSSLSSTSLLGVPPMMPVVGVGSCLVATRTITVSKSRLVEPLLLAQFSKE
jgi:hypothetical protein